MEIKMKLKKGFSLITVEPALFVFMVGSYMEYGVYQDLVYNKLCLEKYNYSRETCDDPHGDALDYVQTQGAYWLQYNNIALLIPSIIAACYLGAWGDRYGRKVPIMLATVSTLLGYLIFLIISVYEDSSIYYTLLANFVSGLGGGYLMIVASMMSYVADVSSREERTTRVAMLESMTSFGSFVGPFVSGYLLEGVGYAYTFLFCVGCNTLVFFYLIVRLKNVLPAAKYLESSSKEGDIFSNSPSSRRAEATCRMTYITEGFVSCFRKREGRKRLYLLLLLGSCLCVFMASNAESDLTYLYVKDEPLSWSYKTYSQYSSLKNALSGSMLLIVLPLLRLVFHLQDTTLTLIGLTSRVAGLLLLSFSTTKVMMFLVPELALFGMFPVPCMRAMLSKLVNASEQGKMFSALATVENITSGVASIIYSNLYPVTRNFFNGFCFIIGVIFIFFPIAIISWMHFQQWKISKRENLSIEVREASETADLLLTFDDTDMQADDEGNTSNSMVY